jgi:cobyrinic acid a,c-diamide synthase
LVPAVENQASGEFMERLIAQCETTFNLSEILRLSEQVVVTQAKTQLFPTVIQPPSTRIAVARDKAFSFYYQDSLDLLEAWGAELVSFSPLEDTALPRNVSGLYIGGGFPELYAARLAANEPLKEAIRRVVGRGMPVYAECGGLMYLGTSLRDLHGQNHSMIGTILISSQINSPRLSLGYRTVQALSDGPLLRRGETVRGHEFHWSVLDSGTHVPNAYRIIDKARQREGFHKRSLLASYIHLHLASQLLMAQRFIANCRHFHDGRKASRRRD